MSIRTVHPRRSIAALAAGSAAVVALSIAPTVTPVAAADPVRWDVPREGPLPSAARSFVVTDTNNAVAMVEPLATGAIAGHVQYRAGFAVRRAQRGPGCRTQWLEIEERAWVCGDRGELSVSPPAAPLAIPDGDSSLPWPYAFTGRDGVRAYKTEAAAIALSDNASDFDLWEANWGFAVESLTGAGDGRVLRSRSGYFLRRRDVYRASPTTFEGAAFRQLEGGERGIPFGWVALGATRVYGVASESGPSEALARLSPVRVYEVRGSSRRAMARIGPDRWARADHLRWIAPEPPPSRVDLARRERWIDVDVSTQTLIAYEGAEPVYATMVSTGGERSPTQPGVFRIWGRYVAHTMDNTESAHLPNHFRLGDVPYVQFFDDDRGLHGVYWHDQFGTPRSHGCVNLSPRDARWLFRFTAGQLRPGWISRAMAEGEGTIVRVRGRFRQR
ncbi:MAG: L,D-transpeptidase [Myxococcales bacterium]|nr:L,D-transpeptidase [Myxococcales bacterium]